MSIEQKKIVFDSEAAVGKECPGYISTKPSKAGIIVLQEWWGVNEQIKKQAIDWFASEFVTIIPDIYRGKVAIDHEEAGHLMTGLDWKGAVDDIQGAARYLKKNGCQKVGVVGFCMGGALSLASAVWVPEIDAASAFYGSPDPKLADPAKARPPVQCHFGTEDNHKGWTDPAAQDALEKKLKESGVPLEFYRYEGCGHAFVNESRPEVYKKEAAHLAHKRTLHFFTKHLLN